MQTLPDRSVHTTLAWGRKKGRILSLCWRPAEDREQYPRGRGHRGLEGKRTRDTPEHESTADTGRKVRQELQEGPLCCAEGRTSETK